METAKKKVSHTPGPWTMDCRDSENHKYPHSTNGLPIIAIVDGAERLIADISHAFVDHSNVAEYEANAKLIAAAPELLEALKAYVDAFDIGHATDFDLRDAAELAIKKATE